MQMSLQIQNIPVRRVNHTKALFQSGFWGHFKSERGHRVEAFQVKNSGPPFQLVVIYRRLSGTFRYGYVPYGPELGNSGDESGVLLEELSESLKPLLPAECIFLRYDLPWGNPFLPRSEPAVGQKPSHPAKDSKSSHPTRESFPDRPATQLHDSLAPEHRIREMRMNFGSSNWNLHKAPTDMQPTDTVIIDLRKSETELLSGMKAKTRYNIRLAGRKKVCIRQNDISGLSGWHQLYRETAGRKGIFLESLGYFQNLFRLSEKYQPEILLLEAYHESRLIAGIIIALYKCRAYYLYGASSYRYRSLMAPHLLQWEALRLAKRKGCIWYDFFGIPPEKNPSHPMHGLYRFKTGFGGSVYHWRGCWDYPFDKTSYESSSLRNAVAETYHKKLNS